MPQQIPIAQLQESDYNARKAFTGLLELSASIQKQGVVQPLLVRPKGKGWEVIDGARRLRAARVAKLTEVPCEVREATDAEAQQLSLVSNCQRADISPVEEGRAYKDLQDTFKLPVAEIAAQVAKPEAHVRQRLALVSLPEDAVEALAAGELQVIVALALARLPDVKARAGACADILRGKEEWVNNKREHVPYSSRDALEYIKREYNLRLAEAPFGLADVELVPGAVACTSCPKRSTNSPMLFPDLAAKEDLCTDSACFAKKREAGWKKKKAELELAGRKVLEGKAAADLVGEYGQIRPGYRKVDERVYDDPKGRTVERLLGKAALLEEVVVVKAKDGKVYELVRQEAVKRALKEKGKEDGTAAAARETKKAETAKQKAAQARAAREAEIKEFARDMALTQLVGQVERDDTTDTPWRMVVEAFLFVRDGMDPVIERRRGHLAPGAHDYVAEDRAQKALDKDAKTLLGGALRGLAVELALDVFGELSAHYRGGSEKPKRFLALCEEYEVDYKKCLADARRHVETKAPEPSLSAKVKKGAGFEECTLAPGMKKHCDDCQDSGCCEGSTVTKKGAKA